MNEIKRLESQIAKLPKGSITRKVIQGKGRYYLQWREGDKVRSRYLKEAELPELSAQIAERKILQQRLVELQVSSIQSSVEGAAAMSAAMGPVVASMAADKVAPYFSGDCEKACGGASPNCTSSSNASLNCMSDNILPSGALRDGARKMRMPLERLANFFLSLGKGFCFEESQKLLVVGDGDCIVDLVFYNRHLHCGLLVNLKCGEFKPMHLEQLNGCVSCYAKTEMHPGDHLPVGLLLCTCEGAKVAEYAIADMDREVFDSTYRRILPTEKELIEFLKGGRSLHK